VAVGGVMVEGWSFVRLEQGCGGATSKVWVSRHRIYLATPCQYVSTSLMVTYIYTSKITPHNHTMCNSSDHTYAKYLSDT
jgi:hypothetical protein